MKEATASILILGFLMNSITAVRVSDEKSKTGFFLRNCSMRLISFFLNRTVRDRFSKPHFPFRITKSYDVVQMALGVKAVYVDLFSRII